MILALILAVGLTGCATLRSTSQSQTETPSQTEPSSQIEQLPASETPAPAAEPTTAAAVPAPDPQPRPPAADPAPEPEQLAALPPVTRGYLSGRLVGLDFAAVRGQLGNPDEIREAAPAQEWVYKDDVCFLTVRFFPEGEALQYKALSVNVRSESSEDGEDARCPQRFAERLQSVQ